MKVHGYTDEKDVVAVDLSIDEIVSAGIDPWQLDLFDPNPLARIANGLGLNFRRLQDIAFAYKPDEHTLLVAVQDGHGSEPICFQGRVSHRSNTMLNLEGAQPSARPFGEHLRRYLRRLEHEDTMDLRRLAYVSDPKAADVVYLVGDGLAFAHQRRSLTDDARGISFTGKMLEEIPVPVALPESINWVLRALAPFQPVVPSAAIRAVLANRHLSQVTVEIAKFALPAALALLAESYGVKSELSGSIYDATLTFEFQGCRYSVTVNTDAPASATRFFHCWDLHSPQWLYSSKPNEVIGSRITFFDLGKKQTRTLCTRTANTMNRDWQSCVEAEQLRIADLKTYVR